MTTKPVVVMHVRAATLNDALAFNRLKGDIKKTLSLAHLIVVHSYPDRTSLEALKTLNKTFAAKLSEELVPALSLLGYHLGLVAAAGTAEATASTHWQIKADALQKLLAQQSVPILAPILQTDLRNEICVQSEWLAAHLAAAIRADLLIFLVETKGILDNGQSIAQMALSDAMRSTTLEAQCAGTSVQHGTQRAFVTDLGGMETILFQRQGAPTEILRTL